MDLALGMLAGIFGTILVAGLFAWFTLRRARSAFAGSGVASAVPLAYSTLDDAEPVLQSSKTCAGCAHFDLRGGQKVMAMNPAFRAASEVIPPWRMGRALKTKPNPEYLALQGEIIAAIAAGDEAKQRGLALTLETLPPEVPIDVEEQIEAPLLSLEWSDFGACRKHKELRASSDACDAWKARLAS
jgi:hypothetical protein